MTIRSPQALRLMLDNLMSGMSWRASMACVGSRSESAGWTWKVKSREAEAAGDTSSVFFLDWPVGSEKQWFHALCDVARDRRGALLATPLLRGEFAIVDGKIAFERDDFGGIVLDDLGVPVVERVAIVEPPAKGKHQPNPDAVYEAMHPRRELAPSSYGINKPREVPVPAYVGSALGDYLKGSKMTVDKQPTALEKDLRDRLAAAKADPSRASARPRPTTIFGRPDPSAPQERISRPSDQTGLPINAEDAPRRAAPQPKPQAVDYSRRAPRVRLDAPGRG
jgi:hypothetical protein